MTKHVNLKKGLLRIWIVLTSIWLLISVIVIPPKTIINIPSKRDIYLVYQDALANYYAKKSLDNNIESTLNRKNIDSELFRALLNAHRAGLNPKPRLSYDISATHEVNSTNFSCPGNSYFVIKYHGDHLTCESDDAVDILYDSIKKVRVISIIKTISIILLPPVIILLIGYTTQWIVRGFKNL